MTAILQISTIDENTHQHPFIFHAGLSLPLPSHFLQFIWENTEAFLRPAKRYNVSSVSSPPPNKACPEHLTHEATILVGRPNHLFLLLLPLWMSSSSEPLSNDRTPSPVSKGEVFQSVDENMLFCSPAGVNPKHYLLLFRKFSADKMEANFLIFWEQNINTIIT